MLLLLRLLLLVLSVSCSQVAANAVTWPHEEGYHNHKTTNEYLHKLHTSFPHLVQLYSIGPSTNRLEMMVIELTAPPSAHREHAPPKRSVRLVGSVYGDETVGREMMLDFAQYLLSTYPAEGEANPATPHLLDLLRVHILPAMNPEGSEVSAEGRCFNGLGRRNAEGVSLDSNFPLVSNLNDSDTHDALQLETKAVINWIKKVPSVLSVTLKANGYVVTYPYETRSHPHKSAIGNLAPDDDILKFLANVYARNNPQIKNETVCNGKSYPNGTINGAVWRNGKGTGGLMDYSYVRAGSMHFNIAITCCRHPTANILPEIWQYNQPALTALMGAACEGLDGIVKDAVTKEPISGARIVIAEREAVAIRSDMNGTFSRILLPGSHSIQVTKAGYDPTTVMAHVNKRRVIHMAGSNITVQVGFVEILLQPATEPPQTSEVAVTVLRDTVVVTTSTTLPTTSASTSVQHPTKPMHQQHKADKSSAHCVNSSILSVTVILIFMFNMCLC